MNAELKIEPTEIWINVMSGGRGRVQPKDIRLTLIVTNPTRSDFFAEHPNSGIFRFWIMQEGSEVWRSANVALQQITPVQISAGQSIEGTELWHIDDARKLSTGRYTAFGEFVPIGLQAQGILTVDEAQ